MYLDTSVVLSAYLPEARSADAAEIIQNATSRFISDLVLAEFDVVLAKKVTTGQVTRPAGECSLALFRKHCHEGVFQRLFFKDLDISGLHTWVTSLPISLRTLDALHLFWAKSEHLPLTTFDERLARVARVANCRVAP